MKAASQPLSKLKEVMEMVPQTLINTEIKRHLEFDKIQGFRELKENIEAELKDEGRLLVRYSGTENLVRVLVEGPDKKRINRYAQKMSSFLSEKLN